MTRDELISDCDKEQIRYLRYLADLFKAWEDVYLARNEENISAGICIARTYIEHEIKEKIIDAVCEQYKDRDCNGCPEYNACEND